MTYGKKRSRGSGHADFGIINLKNISCALCTSCSSNKPGFIEHGSDFRWIELTERRLRKRDKNEKTI